MIFKIGSTTVQVEVAPQITETLDETLDTAQVVLKANNIELPYAPMQEFSIDFENGEVIVMYIVSDQVELFSVRPIAYKHTLTLIQKSRILSKKLVRDSMFSQPIDNIKRGYTATTYIRRNRLTDTFRQFSPTQTESVEWREKIFISSKDKSVDKKVKYKLTVYLLETDGTIKKATSINEITAATSPSFRVWILRKDSSGQEYATTYDIPSDKFTSWNYFDVSQYMGEDFEICIIPFITPEAFLNPEISAARIIVHIDSYIETYYNTAYDLLELLIKRYNTYDDITSKNNAGFSLPTSGDLYDLLTTTVAPNFTFTAMTMYECVAEIFKLFDAIFVLKGNNNELDIEYFNQYEGIVNNNVNFSSSSSKIGEDKYNNKLVNYYQDARLLEKYPSNKTYAGLRTNELGVPSKMAYNMLLPHPIYQVLKVYVYMPKIYLGYMNIAMQEVECNFVDEELDVSYFVLEQSLWSLLNTTADVPYNGDFSKRVQKTTTYYSKGSNYINFSGFYKDPTSIEQSNLENILKYAVLRWSGCVGSSENFSPTFTTNHDTYDIEFGKPRPSSTDYGYRWENIKFRVEYLTILNGKVQIDSITNRFDGEMIIGQQSGAVDLFKLGLNMQGLSLKLGEPTLTMTHKITNWSDRIRKGQYIIKDNTKWIANICQYTLFNDKMIGTIDFSKNFNALSQRIKLNQEKRLTVIDKSLVQKSESLLMEYLYLSSSYDSSKIRSQQEQMYFNNDYLAGGFKKTFTSNLSSDFERNSCVEYVVFDGLDSNDSYYTYIDEDVSSTENKYTRNIFIPVSLYSCGNALCFECSFDDTKSAGNKLSVKTSGWLFVVTRAYFSSYIPYTDKNGFCDKINLKMKFNNASRVFDSLPDLDNSGTSSDSTLINIPGYNYWKQPNEIFALNYQLQVVPLSQRKDIDFVGSKIIKNNAIINERNFESGIFYFYYSISENGIYNILDTKGIGNRFQITNVQSVSTGTTTSYFCLNFTHNANISDLSAVKSWSICDEEGNIYFASNTQAQNPNVATIHFYPRHIKLS